MMAFVEAMGDKIDRLRGLPDMASHRCHLLPGKRLHMIEGDRVIDEIVEDKRWSKVDAVIISALRYLGEHRVESPLATLQEACFFAAFDTPKDSGVRYAALRLIDTRHKVEEYGRLRKVLDGEREPKETDRLFYGDAKWSVIVKQHALVLQQRGLLKKRRS